MSEPMILSPQSPAFSPAHPTWKFWGTVGWRFVVLALMSVVGLALVLVLAGIYGIDLQGGTRTVAERFNPAWLASLESIAVLAPICLVIWFGASRRGWMFSDYLALRLPSRKHFAIGMVATVALLVVTDSLARI